MSIFDPQGPPEKVLVTTGGVQIVVRAAPPPAPPLLRPPPPPPEPLFPDAIVLPANASTRELDAVVASLCEQHRRFVLQVLLRRGDVLPASAPDLAQNVVLALWEYVRKHEPPKNVLGFVCDLIDKEVIDHKRWRGRRPKFDREADVLSVADEAPDPEESVDAVQHMEKVRRCMATLPHEQAEAVRYIELLEATIKVAAAMLERPQSSVAADRHRGIAKLKELANVPEETAPLARRGDGRRR